MVASLRSRGSSLHRRLAVSNCDQPAFATSLSGLFFLYQIDTFKRVVKHRYFPFVPTSIRSLQKMGKSSEKSDIMKMLRYNVTLFENARTIGAAFAFYGVAG